MLVLTRKKDQSIIINENIEITVLDIQGDRVRIGINAPREYPFTGKSFHANFEENKTASANVKRFKDVIARSQFAVLKRRRTRIRPDRQDCKHYLLRCRHVTGLHLVVD